MSRRILAIVVASNLWWSGGALAEEVDAGSLADSCKSQLAESRDAASMCRIYFLGLLDGNEMGAERGLRTAFVEDTQNSATVRGVDDLIFRVSLLRRAARCIPPQATSRQVAEVFVQYVESNPAHRSRPYRDVIREAIESYYCGD